MNSAATHRFIEGFADITIDDVPLVGGKNASLGEMVRELAGRRSERTMRCTPMLRLKDAPGILKIEGRLG